MPHLKTKDAAERYLVTLDDMLQTKRDRISGAVEGGTRLTEQEAALEYAIECIKGRMALLGWLRMDSGPRHGSADDDPRQDQGGS